MAIRILHLIGSLRLGGAQVVVKHIVENASEDVEHFVYPLRPKKIDIPIKGNILSNPYPNYDPRKFFDILKVCKKHNIDIIHAHLHKPILGALLATYFQKTPVIVHEHGPIFRLGIQYAIYRLGLRLLRKRSYAIIANSQATAHELMQRSGVPKSNIHVIYNAVDLDRFQPDPAARKDVRKQFAFSDNDIVIGFVGRLHPVKGVDLLVQAMPSLVQENPHFKLILVGTGHLCSSLKKYVHDNGLDSHVYFAGFQKDTAEIMNAFDLGCMPSRQEPFGIVALEMMSMNIPLVCSTADGLAELAKDHQTALVLRDNTPDEIVSCILELNRSSNLKKQLKVSATSFCQQFSVSDIVRNIETVYKKIISIPPA